MSHLFRSICALTFGLMPAARLKNWLLTKVGNEIHPTAHVSPMLLLPNARIIAAEQSRIGGLTAVRGAVVELGECAELGQLNWISAAPFLVRGADSTHAGILRIAEHASVTNRHYIDVSGGVSVGRYSTVAGVRSTFMTHGIDVASNTLVTSPIIIGEYAMVGGSCDFVLGAVVPDRSIVGMGSVVLRGLEQPGGLYVGNPAKYKRPSDLGAYGRRSVGAVPPATGSRP